MGGFIAIQLSHRIRMASQDDLGQLPGVGPATEDKLKDAGYETFQSIASASAGDLAQKADIGDSTASDIIQAAREEADIGGFETGNEVMDHRLEVGKISTLIPEIDQMMGGGIETQSVTEIYGGYGAGKSQLTHQMCVNVQLPRDVGGLQGRAIFIDTEDSFRPERIAGMACGLEDEAIEAVIERDDLDLTLSDIRNSEYNEDGSPVEGSPGFEFGQHFLARVDVADAFTTDHQMLLAEKALDIANEHAESDFPVRLLCVDSITSHFRAEYVGRGELAERQQKLNRHFHDIKKVANLHNAAVIIANQISANPDSFFGPGEQPIGGNILGHNSTFRLYVRNSKGNKRIVKLNDAPNLPDGEAVWRVEPEGLKPE